MGLLVDMDLRDCTPAFLLSLLPLIGKQVVVRRAQFEERVQQFGGEAAQGIAEHYRPDGL